MLTVHVVSHTHWDREWYHPAERFRQRLVALIDETLDARLSESTERALQKLAEAYRELEEITTTIDTTLEKTLLGDRDPGWRFNFEADVLAKGVVHTLQRMHGAGERIA